MVYLSGEITGCSDKECVEWRDEATRLFAFRGIGVYNPMIRDYRNSYADVPSEEIVLPDLCDLRASAALLVKLSEPSWRTAMEMAYATLWGRPIAVVGTPVSPWILYHASGIYADLPSAADAISGWIT